MDAVEVLICGDAHCFSKVGGLDGAVFAPLPDQAKCDGVREDYAKLFAEASFFALPVEHGWTEK